jgi:Cdc6-like AAA superfamily ATPase
VADQPFVARERELAQLNDFLDGALGGQGQVCFVTGEAGAGKTASFTCLQPTSLPGVAVPKPTDLLRL